MQKLHLSATISLHMVEVSNKTTYKTMALWLRRWESARKVVFRSGDGKRHNGARVAEGKESFYVL